MRTILNSKTHIYKNIHPLIFHYRLVLYIAKYQSFFNHHYKTHSDTISFIFSSNSITLFLYLPKNKIKNNIFIDIPQNMAKISSILVGEIAIKKDSLSVNNKCSLSLKPEDSSPLSIESISLDFVTNNILHIKDMHKQFKGGGIYKLEVSIPENISLNSKTG